jgi:hypothetical protein
LIDTIAADLAKTIVSELHRVYSLGKALHGFHSKEVLSYERTFSWECCAWSPLKREFTVWSPFPE